MDVPNLDATPVVPKTGDEPLHESGRLLGQHLRDFWAWAYSDLLGNAMRGVLAEYLVGTALGCVHGRTRLEWDAWDLRTVDGIRLEIKSAAYLQSWRQSAYSRIGFDIRPTTAWYAETNTYSSDRRRQADVYVFCLFAHRDKATADPLDVGQWQFYVTSTRRLDGSSPVRWCTTSSRDSSSVDQAVKAGVTSSVPSVTLSAGLSVRERASTSRPR
ncbi:hypothetical protein ACWDT5_01160 [Rhodococcus aetherivorans]